MWRSAKPHTYPTPHVLCCFSCVWLFVILWTVACQAPLSMRFPRQQYWSGLPCPLPGDLLDLGIELTSPALAGGFFTTEPRGKHYPTPGLDIKNLFPRRRKSWRRYREVKRSYCIHMVCVCVLWESMKYDDRQGKVESKGNLGPSWTELWKQQSESAAECRGVPCTHRGKSHTPCLGWVLYHTHPSSQESVEAAGWISVRSGRQVTGPLMASWSLLQPRAAPRAARSWVTMTAGEWLRDRGAHVQRTRAHPSSVTTEPALWFFHQRLDPEFPPTLHTTVRDPAKESSLKLLTDAQSALRSHIWPRLSALTLLGWSPPPGRLLGQEKVFPLSSFFPSLSLTPCCPQSSSYQLRSPQQVFSPEPRLYLVPRPHDNQTCPMNPSTSLSLRQKPHFRLSLLTWRISAIQTSHSSNSKSSPISPSNISLSF